MLDIYFFTFFRAVGGGAPRVWPRRPEADRRVAAAYGDGSRQSEHPKMLKIISVLRALELADDTFNSSDSALRLLSQQLLRHRSTARHT